MDGLSLLKRLSHEVRDLDVGEAIDVLTAPIDPAQFLREYVGPNRPLLIKDGLNHMAALHKWTPSYLGSLAGEQMVSVDFTPNGLGDAVTPCATGECFCIPYKQKMRFQQFLDKFFASKTGGSSSSSWIPYLQQQNSNLTQELPVLLADVDAELAFAAEAFGAAPEAVNLWIGDERSSTTFHKDHYENLYAVVAGSKTFHLLPPSDVFRMGLQLYLAAQFQPVDEQLVPVLVQPPSHVMWSPVHPEPSDPITAHMQHPLFFDDHLPKPLRVEVAAGDVLYLPAMWWHYVQQQAHTEQGWCVAVNYWYDMRFDVKYAYYQMAESIATELGLVPVMPHQAASRTQDEQHEALDDGFDDDNCIVNG